MPRRRDRGGREDTWLSVGPFSACRHQKVFRDAIPSWDLKGDLARQRSLGKEIALQLEGPICARAGVPRAPGTFGELKRVQHGWSTENKMMDSESGGSVQMERKGGNISRNLGRAETWHGLSQGMEQWSSSAKNRASSLHSCLLAVTMLNVRTKQQIQ